MTVSLADLTPVQQAVCLLVVTLPLALLCYSSQTARQLCFQQDGQPCLATCCSFSEEDLCAWHRLLDRRWIVGLYTICGG